MKKGILIVSKAIILTMLTGCVSNPMLPNYLNAGQGVEGKSLTFKTNTNRFITSLNNKSTKESRNRYIDEFILQSDMQCKSYLTASQNKPKVSSLSKNELYMNIFDTVSSVFGIKYITDTAKNMLSGNSDAQLENQKAYEQALSPEIYRGVEINRERYVQKIKQKQKLPIKKYASVEFKQDMLTYDKQCNEDYGLIEINRALKAMQNHINQPHQSMKPSINIKAVKEKVEKVTKKVQAKEKKVQEKKKQESKENNNSIKPNK